MHVVWWHYLEALLLHHGPLRLAHDQVRVVRGHKYEAALPGAIQPHLQSCFDSVVYAEFGKKDYANCIEVLQSGDGQTIKLVNRVRAEGNIEEWLDRLLKEMQNTVNRIISYCVSDCEVLDSI